MATADHHQGVARAHDEAQVPPRLGVRVVAVFVVLQLLLLAALLAAVSGEGGAAPVKGEVAVSSQDGYARLVFTLAEETEADVRLANGIVVIAFKQPVDVSVDRIPMQAAGYVDAARADPDGAAVRLALNRKVTVNTMAAGEKLFVDLLPEGWSGLPPGLAAGGGRGTGAARARGREEGAGAAASRAAARAAAGARARRRAADLHALHLRLPALIAVSVERNDDKMTMTFEAPLRFDLADVQAALPPTVAAVDVASARRQRVGAASTSSARSMSARSARTTITSSMFSRSVARRRREPDRPSRAAIAAA